MIKMLIIFSIILSLILFTACNTDEKENPGVVAVRMHLEMKDYSAATYMTDSHTWQADDKVQVFSSDGISSDVAEPVSDGTSRALFMYAMQLEEEHNTLVGLYPADTPVEVTCGKMKYEIPQQQDGTLMPLQGGKASVKKGTYEGGSMRLTPLYKVLNVWAGRSNRTIRSVTVKAEDGSPIAGKTETDIDAWTHRATSASVTVTLKEPLDCSSGGHSIPVMVADCPTDGYIAEITDVNGETTITDKVVQGLYSEEKSYELGISQALFGSFSKSSAASMINAGVRHIEVTMNTFWRGYTLEECYKRARDTKKVIEETAGLNVWSVHLPFSSALDISLTDDVKRAGNVATMAEMIRLAGEFKPEKLVLHPSSEPISEGDRAKRLACAKESIGKLLPVAKEIGAQLCIENLPRTCLGRTSDEMKILIEDYPEVMICFDSNHLLIEDHNTFFKNVGERIGTIHASDYDKVDERHWMPGAGIINWPLFLTNLIQYGYEGVFMTEVKSGTAAGVADAYKNVICVTNK